MSPRRPFLPLTLATGNANNLRNEIDGAFTDIYAAINAANSGSTELQPYLSPGSALLDSLTRYLCVAISGYIESCIRNMYRQYTLVNSTGFVANYVDVMLSGFQNAPIEKIIELTGQFDTTWADNIKAEVKASNFAPPVEHPITLVVKAKNSIAHGASSNLSLNDLHMYYHEIIRMLVFIENQCAITHRLVDPVLHCH